MFCPEVSNQGPNKGRVILGLLLGLILSGAPLNADAFKDGLELFMRDKSNEAIALFQKALREDPKAEKPYLYLGLCYWKDARLDEAIAILRRGQALNGELAYAFAYNLGNCYYRQGKNAFAEDLYSEALGKLSSHAESYLNRANARMNQKKYNEAIEDFERYLSLAPASPKRPDIERVVALLRESQAETDRKKAEAEREKAAEEARKLKLIEDVTNSLKDAAADTQSLSAGAEGAQGYDDESQLAD